MKQNTFWPDCIKKCGNKSYHKTGLCVDCRTSTCGKCGKKYASRIVGAKVCQLCANAGKKRAKISYIENENV